MYLPWPEVAGVDPNVPAGINSGASSREFFIVNNIIAFGVLIVASYLIQKILVYILDDIPDNAGKWSSLEELVRGIKRKLTNKK